ncbi:MAG: hypothetical protein GY906_15270, partial [bacterium]|nr:hypothetical protein [bacterium]
TLTVTGLTIVTWMVAYLALVDIWHGQEPDFSGEWLATYAALIALTICLTLSIPVLLVTARCGLIAHTWMIVLLATAAALAAIFDLRAFQTIASQPHDLAHPSWKVVSIGFVPIGLFLISNVAALASAIRQASVQLRVIAAPSQCESGSSENTTP